MRLTTTYLEMFAHPQRVVPPPREGLAVVHAKEPARDTMNGRKPEFDYRWSGPVSSVKLPGIGNQRVLLTIVTVGYRPSAEPPMMEFEFDAGPPGSTIPFAPAPAPAPALAESAPPNLSQAYSELSMLGLVVTE